MTVIIAAFLPIFAIVSMFPAVPAMIEHFAADPDARWKVPAMVSAPGLTIAILALFAGVLVDRFGRRRLLLASTFLYGVFGAAPFFLSELNHIYASRLLLGVAEAAILTTLNTLIGDYWDDRGRRNWLTLQGIAGPFLASGVIFTSGHLTGMQWNAIFLIYLVAFPIFAAMWAFLYEPADDTAARRMLGIGAEPARTPFPWSAVVRIGALTLFASALYYVFIINGGIVWQEIGVLEPERIGALTTVPSLFVMAGAAIFWLLGRWGVDSRKLIAAFLLVLGAGLALIGIAKSVPMMITALIVQQTGAGMAVPTLIAWAQRDLPFEHRGRGMGVWTACFFFGQFSSPLLVGALRSALGAMQPAFLVAGVAGVLAAAAVFLMMPRDRAAPAMASM